MATYNGEGHITEQTFSILEQLTSDDELIVVDDSSIDNTIQVIKKINDCRIRIYINEKNRGHVFSFARAISLAKNEIIFLSDQDDIWIKGRVALMKKKLLDTGVLVVSSNFDIMNMVGEIKKFTNSPLKSKDSTRYFYNILGIFLGKRGYYGCTMAFRKKIIDLVLPIPFYIKAHDLWIAVASNLIRSNAHIEEITLIRRIHNTNLSNPHRKLSSKLYTRLILSVSILSLIFRIMKRSYK